MDVDRFKILTALGRPGATKAVEQLQAQFEEQKESRTLNNDEDIARRLHEWAKSRLAREVFLERVVVPAIERARAGVYANIGKPELLAFYLGMQKSAEDLYSQFLTWAGQAQIEPPQEES